MIIAKPVADDHKTGIGSGQVCLELRVFHFGSLIGTANEDTCRRSSLPYGERVRPLQVDMMAFDEADQTIRAYEVKRGAGEFDARKIRAIKRDLMCIQVLLKSYGETAAVKPQSSTFIHDQWFFAAAAKKHRGQSLVRYGLFGFIRPNRVL